MTPRGALVPGFIFNRYAYYKCNRDAKEIESASKYLRLSISIQRASEISKVRASLWTARRDAAIKAAICQLTDVRYHRTVRMGTPVGERSKSWGRRHCYCVGAALISAVLAATVAARPAIGQSQQTITQPDEPEANPARPTVSNPATLTPVGYLQFETGMLGATYSLEFSTRYEFNEVIKLAVTRRLEFVEASEPTIHYTVNGISANGVAEVFLGAQVVLLPGEGAKPTLSASYSRRIYDGGAPELDVGSPLNSSVLYASADVMGFHYDANAIFNEVLDGRVRRLQFGQTLSVSHPLGKGFGLSGEIWRFSQPFERGNAIGNLWAASYAARKTLVFDAGFEKGLTGTSTHWEAFAGLTYLLPHRLCKR